MAASARARGAPPATRSSESGARRLVSPRSAQCSRWRRQGLLLRRRRDDTFNDAIWLTYNLPPLHLVDYDRFVKAWKKDGTQRMGIFKGAEAAGPDDPNSASQVVRRHLSATSPSPLYQ